MRECMKWDHHYFSGNGSNYIKHGIRKANLIMQIDNFHQFLRPKDPAKIEEDRTKMKNKVDKLRNRMYINPVTIISLTHVFYVHKWLNNPDGIQRHLMRFEPSSLGTTFWPDNCAT